MAHYAFISDCTLNYLHLQGSWLNCSISQLANQKFIWFQFSMESLSLSFSLFFFLRFFTLTVTNYSSAGWDWKLKAFRVAHAFMLMRTSDMICMQKRTIWKLIGFSCFRILMEQIFFSVFPMEQNFFFFRKQYWIHIHKKTVLLSQKVLLFTI